MTLVSYSQVPPAGGLKAAVLPGAPQPGPAPSKGTG